MEQTLKKIALGTAALAVLSLPACVGIDHSKLQPRAGYDLVFSPNAITSGPVDCAMLDPQLASAVRGCRDYAPIVDRQTYDTDKFEEQEIWETQAPVSCGWLRADSATVSAVPDCYVWVKRDAPDAPGDTAAAPAPSPAPASGRSSSNDTGGTSVSSSSTSGPDGDTDSAASSTGGVSTSASSTSNSDGTGGFSVDNGHTSMSGTFGADGSVDSVSFGGSSSGSNSQ